MQKYKVLIWRTDNSEEEHDLGTDRSWIKIYPLINADTIQIQKGFITGFSKRSFEILIDEEGKLKNKKLNDKANCAWYNWLTRANRVPVMGDYIAGDVAVIQKINTTI